MTVKIRYGTLTEIPTHFNEMTERDLKNMAKIGYGVKVGTLTQLDEKSWDAFNVQAPVVDGQIVNCILDVGGTLYLQGDFPVEVALGSQVRVHFTYQNTGDVTTQFYYSIEILDPDELQRAYAEGNNPCDPGWQKASARTNYITIDKGGIWVVHGILWVL